MVNKIKSAIFIGILLLIIVGVALIINFYPTSTTPAQGPILNWACRGLVNNANKVCNKRVEQEIVNATKRANTQCDTRVGEEVGNANTQCDTRVAGVNTQCDTRVGAEVGKVNAQFKKIKDEIKEAMMSAAQSTGAGNLPGSIQRMISDLTEPKLNWREIIQQQIMSTMKSDYTFIKPSRRSWHMDAILPGMINTDTIDICLAIDASGSISEQQCRDFLGEIQGIMEQYKDFKIHLWSFDTKVFNPKVFTPDNMDELSDYVIGAGGGTDFMCNWEFMKEEGIEPKKFIMFTDGWPFDSWGDKDYCDTIFLINNSYERNIQAPFGMTVNYED